MQFTTSFSATCVSLHLLDFYNINKCDHFITSRCHAVNKLTLLQERCCDLTLNRFLYILYIHTENPVSTRWPFCRMPKTTYRHSFSSFDLEIDPMTLICDLYLNILKMHLQTKNEVCSSNLSKVRAQTGQTDRQTRPNALPRHIHTITTQLHKPLYTNYRNYIHLTVSKHDAIESFFQSSHSYPFPLIPAVYHGRRTPIRFPHFSYGWINPPVNMWRNVGAGHSPSSSALWA